MPYEPFYGERMQVYCFRLAPRHIALIRAYAAEHGGNSAALRVLLDELVGRDKR